jgi:bifunctional UDP-N-acetylglucosamine pyrophosphorylase/glucosamine-1-phosphate N-acetyltransferase
MRDGRRPVVIEGEEFETAGVNSRAELAHLELDWQRRRRERALHEGATLIDPESVWFSADTQLGRDCTIEPHVVFGPEVKIADGAVIHAFCHIAGQALPLAARSAHSHGFGPVRCWSATPGLATSSR